MHLKQKLFYALAGFVLGISVFSGASSFNGNQPAERGLSPEQVLGKISEVNAGTVPVNIAQTVSAPISFHLFRILFILFFISPPIIVVLLLVIISKMNSKDSIK